ncbi:MAG: hypothetical protein COB67_01950 [SAR324 cluster bacterium]|uniref:histidine kinase n=1 Tax=SAR324 cluster bacterium TaxID=2024889 RepID=A0A2A4TAN4_9DELT|nr:MAG: hypothetical protein COB67_01950 [SAR324 cluster bacterium]
MIQWFRNRSIFLKVFIVILLSALFVNLVVGAIFSWLFRPPKTNYHQILQGFTTYLVEDLLQNPTQQKGEILSQNLGIQIRFENNKIAWSTSAIIPPLKILKKAPNFFRSHSKRERTLPSFQKELNIRKYQNRIFLILPHGENTIIITPQFSFPRTLNWWLLIILLIVSLIFLLSYLALRRMFFPIQQLTEGVKQVGQGKFELVLPSKNMDELGKLTQAFNNMTRKVRELLQSKEQLLLDVSHELRSPLTRMKVALEFLPESKSKKNIAEDLNIMQQMLTELLESARLDSQYGGLQLQEENLTPLIRQCLKKYEGRTPGIKVSLPNSPLLLCLDASRIQIVFNNLLENALKYSSNSSQPVEFQVEKMETKLQISIQDFGVGIPQKHQPFVFDPFYRVDKSRSKKTGGYGLGLSLCRKIIHAHQGSIDLDGSVREGTKVVIQLPLLESLHSS